MDFGGPDDEPIEEALYEVCPICGAGVGNECATPDGHSHDERWLRAAEKSVQVEAWIATLPDSDEGP